MKYFLNILIVALMMASVSAEAQVSVRRTSKKTTEATTSAKDAPSKKAAAKAAAKSSTKAEPAPVRVETPVQANQTVVKKNTVAERKATTTRQQSPNQVNESSSRRQIFDEYQKRAETTDARWQNVIYRELDMNKDANASLYWPQEPVDGMTNLFRVIFEALVSGQLKAYEYLDGREIFDEKHVVNVKDLLDRYEVLYQDKPANRNGAARFVVEDSDVPCNEVLSYYVKERWEFDKNSSQFAPHVLAICPVLHRAGDFGGEMTKYPMFWLNYEELRPFITQQLILSAGMNTAPRYTMEDYFTLHQYEGTIYKVQNPRGLTLMQQYPDPAELEKKRTEIEAQLRSFGKDMWVPEVEPQTEEVESKNPIRRRLTRKDDERAEVAEAEGRAVESDGSVKKNRRTKEEVDLDAAAEKKASRRTTRSVRR